MLELDDTVMNMDHIRISIGHGRRLHISVNVMHTWPDEAEQLGAESQTERTWQQWPSHWPTAAPHSEGRRGET